MARYSWISTPLQTATVLPSAENARKDGESFGRAVGKRAAQNITRPGLSSKQLERAGLDGVASIIARAKSLASAGLDPVMVSAWTEGVAGGFNSELDSAASLLRAASRPGAKH
jgi:hypothetical protein